MLLLSFGRNYSKFRPLLSKFSTFLYCSSVTTNWHLQFRFYIYYRPYTWIFYGILQGHNGHIYSVGKLHAWQREKVVSMRVSVRNIWNACVSRKMRESWKVCISGGILSQFCEHGDDLLRKFSACKESKFYFSQLFLLWFDLVAFISISFRFLVPLGSISIHVFFWFANCWICMVTLRCHFYVSSGGRFLE